MGGYRTLKNRRVTSKKSRNETTSNEKLEQKSLSRAPQNKTAHKNLGDAQIITFLGISKRNHL